jgi:hypothetical protein
MSTPLKAIYLWRRENGINVRYRFNVVEENKQWVIESEERVDAAPGNTPGLKVRTDALGNQHIVSASPEYMKLFSLFRGWNNTKCFFEGCDQLLSDYHKEIESLGPKCPDCRQGEITRKYISLANNILAKT